MYLFKAFFKSTYFMFHAGFRIRQIMKNYFPRQSIKKFTFRVNIFLLGLSTIVKLIWHEKQILLSILRRKYCLIHLEIVKAPKKWNRISNKIVLPPTSTQLYLVWIRFRRLNFLCFAFTISKRLKKYYFCSIAQF